MAGTVALSPNSRWSASSWLFDWTVRFMAQHAGRPDVAADLEQVIDENLGWVDIGDFPPEVRQTLVETLQRDLVPAAEGQLPTTMPERQRALDHIRELADLARRLSDA
jgi:hypothetical protein